MSERKFSRRAICIGGLGTLAYAETQHINDAKNPNFVIDSEARNRLAPLARDLSTCLDSSTFSVFSAEQAGQIRIKPNSGAFAMILLQMSYIDGGNKEVSDVFRFIKERGLSIGSKVIGRNLATMEASDSINEPIQINFREDTTKAYFDSKHKSLSEIAVIHELQHVIQQSRDPNRWDNYIALEDAAGYAVQWAVGANVGLKNYNSVPRRDLLSLGVNLGMGLALGYVANKMAFNLGGSMRPVEQEAYSRSEVVKNMLLIDDFDGKIFIKEKAV